MSGFDVTEVKQAAAGRWAEILPAVTGIDPAILNPKQHFPCPRCGGTDRFRAFDDFKSTGGVHCNKCHADKNGDGLAAIQWLAGCEFGEALQLVASHLGLSARKSSEAPLTDEQFLESLCVAKKMPRASAEAYGAKVTNWGNRAHGGERVVEFPVYDHHGEPCGRFAISHVAKDEKLRKGKFAKGASHGLFLPHGADGKPRLPQPGEAWILVEGVKDAAALHGRGYLAAGLPTSNMAKKFARLFAGVAVVIIPDLDEAGQKGAQQTASRLKGTAASVKLARLPGELKSTDGADVRDVLAAPDGEPLVRQAIADAVEWSNGKSRAANDSRPEVLISTDEYATNDAAAAQLAYDPELFQRGGRLVTVAVGDRGHDGPIHREATQPRISEVSKSALRERLSRTCYFVTETAEGELTQAHPPEWCTKAIHDRGEWPGVRQLIGVTASPIVRPDGTVVTKRGYDRSTGLYLAGDTVEISVDDTPSQADAKRAAELLMDVVCDFPFERPTHRAAWLSAVLTPLARYTFDGPTPLHVFDANAPGSGKTLLAELVANITMGSNIARMANPRDDDEARKRITALAISGDPIVLIDNVNGGLGCSSLDAALTGTRWQDRVLGASQMVDLLLLVTWLASGNNVVLRADTSRRALHVRLRSNVESPESRTGFRYPNVRAHVKAQRGPLLSAALTILRAWFAAGRPQAAIPAWGSFEDWSGVVRQAIVFAGQPDPAATRQEFVATADQDAMALRAVLQCWPQIDPNGRGLTAGQILKALDSHPEMREAFMELCPPSGAAPLPSVRQVGSKLGHLRGRVIGGRAIDCREAAGRTRLWSVTTTTQLSQPIESDNQDSDSCDSCDSFKPPYARENEIPPTDREAHTRAYIRPAGKESLLSQESLSAPPTGNVTCEGPRFPEVDATAELPQLPGHSSNGLDNHDACPKCSHPEAVDVPIHGGKSLRRDCARCGHTIGFPEWKPAKMEVAR